MKKQFITHTAWLMAASILLVLCLTPVPVFAALDPGHRTAIETAAAAGDIETMTAIIETAVADAVANGDDPAAAVEEALKSVSAAAFKAGLDQETLESIVNAASITATFAAAGAAQDAGVAFDADALADAAARGVSSGILDASGEMGITLETGVLEGLTAAAAEGAQTGFQQMLAELPPSGDIPPEPEAYEEPGDSDLPPTALGPAPPPAPVVDSPPAPDQTASPT